MQCSERLRKVQIIIIRFLKIFGIFFRAMFESPDKMGLGEPKKSPHKDPFCQNIPLRGSSGSPPVPALDSGSTFRHPLIFILPA